MTSEQIDQALVADTVALRRDCGDRGAGSRAHEWAYGFHRDELQVLSDARHLDWGFVPYPPLTPFVERIGLSIFGLSMVGLRMFSVIAQAFAIVFTGLMARELGGGRLRPGDGSACDCALSAAAVRRDGISIHDL